MDHPGEPSVEEILDSIKKVIARDNREGAIAERRRRSQQAVEDRNPEPADGEEAEEVLELDEDAMVALDGDADLDEDYDFEAEEPRAEDDAELPLTADQTRQSMRANFEALATLARPGAAPQIVRSGETSLEGLVRDMLRPMLAEWLDDNLPGMVEEMVKAEIARIAGKRS
ncbi:DUF2497 domain-containing protein [Qipengyuania sp. MTN3-11]|uniref:DUF2497 domain-containing protein n=1 Tax=Qipengyuania sp. MTN3-11 TaxID=3056557 RepID=UPI0036F3E369